jgi:hypothetical protein
MQRGPVAQKRALLWLLQTAAIPLQQSNYHERLSLFCQDKNRTAAHRKI